MEDRLTLKKITLIHTEVIITRMPMIRDYEDEWIIDPDPDNYEVITGKVTERFEDENGDEVIMEEQI